MLSVERMNVQRLYLRPGIQLASVCKKVSVWQRKPIVVRRMFSTRSMSQVCASHKK